MNAFGLSDAILNQIIGVISKFSNIDKAVIFGSRAAGNFRPSSDIDIAIVAPHLDAITFSNLWNQLDDLPIIYKLDVVHFDALTNENLKQKIETQSKVIYQKNE